MTIARSAVLLLTLSLFWPLARAADSVAVLESFLKDLRSLQADFRQTQRSPGQSGLVVSQGTFYLRRPGRFRWEYMAPLQQLIVGDGERVWLYDQDLDQVSHMGQERALRGTPAALLSSEQPLREHFELIGQGQVDGLNWVELTPLDGQSQVLRMRAGLADDGLRLLEMEDQFGQFTRIEFFRVLRNPRLDDALFAFEPPAGIDVLSED